MRSARMIVMLLVLINLPFIADSKEDRSIRRNQPSERRTALVIGNSNYANSPLKNPVNDARDMAKTLEELGFTVIHKENAGLRDMEKAVSDFEKQLRQGGAGLFYYAGHGIQVKGSNYLIPTDAEIETESDVRYKAMDAGQVLGKMEDAGNGLNIVILDACRNNPFGRSFRSAQQGLAQMDAPAGSVVIFATGPNSVAADGAGRNGTFTKHLLTHIKTPGLKLEDVAKNVRRGVAQDTGNKQIPWEHSSLMGDFYFASSGAVVYEQPVTSAPPVSPAKTALSVKCNIDGANVLIDGRVVGQTPLKALPMSAGDYRIIIEKEGYETYRENIGIEAGQAVSLRVELSRKTSSAHETTPMPQSTYQTKKGSVKLGVAGAHSGDLASYGLPTIKAAELVVRDINAKGGISGRQVLLVSEDDVCKPEVAANTATKLVSEGVNVVLGHICSGATRAALGIYNNAQIVVMSPSATTPELTQSGKYPNFFRAISSDDMQAKLEVDFAVNMLRLERIAILHDKGDYGKGLADFAKGFLAKSGNAQIVLYEGIMPGSSDYSAIVRKIKQSDAEAVIFGGYHPEASKIVIQMRQNGMKTIFISDDGVKDDTFIKVAGKDAEGVYATGPRDTSKNPMAVKAIQDHKDAYKSDPGAFYLNAYSAALALLNAIQKAGSTDYDAIVKALRTQDVETPLGTIKFDERGDAIGIGFSMYQVKNGVYVELK